MCFDAISKVSNYARARNMTEGLMMTKECKCNVRAEHS